MHKRLAVLFSAALLAQGAAAELTVTDIPAAAGDTVARAVRYRDSTGDFLLVASQSPVRSAPPVAGTTDPTRNQSITASAFRLEPDGTVKRAWAVHDRVRQCDLEISAAFREDLISVTDLNGDGVAEVWLPYVLACRSDPGPTPAKIIVREGARKYAVRGETFFREGGKDYGGAGSLDMEGATPAMTAYAKALWTKFTRGGTAR